MNCNIFLPIFQARSSTEFGNSWVVDGEECEPREPGPSNPCLDPPDDRGSGSKESSKETSKESSKASSKESSKASSKESSKASSKQSSKASSKESSKASSKESSKASSKESSKAKSKESSKEKKSKEKKSKEESSSSRQKRIEEDASDLCYVLLDPSGKGHQGSCFASLYQNCCLPMGTCRCVHMYLPICQ